MSLFKKKQENVRTTGFYVKMPEIDRKKSLEVTKKLGPNVFLGRICFKEPK